MELSILATSIEYEGQVRALQAAADCNQIGLLEQILTLLDDCGQNVFTYCFITLFDSCLGSLISCASEQVSGPVAILQHCLSIAFVNSVDSDGNARHHHDQVTRVPIGDGQAAAVTWSWYQSSQKQGSDNTVLLCWEHWSSHEDRQAASYCHAECAEARDEETVDDGSQSRLC